LFNPKYGKIGMVAVPFYVFGEMLAPVIELFGYLITALGLCIGAVNEEFAIVFLSVALGYGLLLSLWTLALEEVTYRRYPRVGDFLKLCAFAILENFGYRQLTVWFRLQAFWKYARGNHSWGVQRREGFAAVAAAVKPV
jgi:hypothetical protein